MRKFTALIVNDIKRHVRLCDTYKECHYIVLFLGTYRIGFVLVTRSTKCYDNLNNDQKFNSDLDSTSVHTSRSGIRNFDPVLNHCQCVTAQTDVTQIRS